MLNSTLTPNTTNELDRWEETYLFLKGFAIRNNMRNTLIALHIAVEKHKGQTRTSGAPFVLHPLTVTSYLIKLPLEDRIIKKEHQYRNLPDYDANVFDVFCAAAVLHDVLEDCNLKHSGNEFLTEYKLDPEILDIVLLLTKKKGYDTNEYYSNISQNWKALLIKLSDRTNNCSTLDSFSPERMTKYVKETVTIFYPLCRYCKDIYPEFSDAVTIMKYLMESICETVASVLKIPDVINSDILRYRKTYSFLEGYAKKDMKNTTLALSLSKRYYDGLTRKSGDPFIIHPLRVCSYLISLNISDDEVCAASLLHEITKKCNLSNGGSEVLDFGISKRTLDLVHKVANYSSYSIDEYYNSLKNDADALVIKLSNRANTCTTLIDSSQEELENYINETEKYIYPLGEYGMDYYPQYKDAIDLMLYQIRSVSIIVKRLKPSNSKELLV